MKKFFLNNRLHFAGAVVGGIAGFIYWKFIGCVTGICPITSNPYRCTIYFGIMGALLAGMFRKNKTVSSG